VHEARWPNKKEISPMNPEGAKIDSGGDGFLIAKSLPDGLPDDYFKGATIWVAADRIWSTWTDRVTGYSSREKKLLFDMPAVVVDGTWPIKPTVGVFYLVGKKELLDSPGEWYYDAGNKTLYLWAPKGDNPNGHLVAAKKRMLAFDLKGKRYIQLVGIGVEGATLDMENSEYCLVERMRARYISHTRGGKTDSNLHERTGIYVTGTRW